MVDHRKRLLQDSQLDGIYTIVEYIKDEDTDTTLAYKVRDLFAKSEHATELFSNTFSPLDFSRIDEELAQSSHYFILTEYYPVNGCIRNTDGSLSYDGTVTDKEKFDEGRGVFFRDYLDMCKPNGERQFGIPIDYITLNNTAYCLFDFDEYEYRKKLRLLDKSITAPEELVPPYMPLPELNYIVKNNDLVIKGVDFSREPYRYLLEDIMDVFGNRLNDALSEERNALQAMINQLFEFESSDNDESLGTKEKQITRDDMDKELGEHNTEWRYLRHLLKEGDEFWQWVMKGECWGVSMVRNGRTFKTWVTSTS